MGIGVQSKSGGEVTQHTGYCLDVHAVLECNSGECVPEVVKSDLGQSRPFQNPLQHMVDAVRGDGATVW